MVRYKDYEGTLFAFEKTLADVTYIFFVLVFSSFPSVLCPQAHTYKTHHPVVLQVYIYTAITVVRSVGMRACMHIIHTPFTAVYTRRPSAKKE